ncbi:hypothetical protein [Pseudoalteromonas peptidolytica]|uniref:hypothetical protein n=1 Tax=Pseudoalteromonas peptidolytica TaxID=61150 RepID=UPI00298E4F6E|nr:hypothetical protein [Pseudoalteromonas peptidolytica]MDW7547736.1 hypothetical protein [Pseudoalteromonas peptidolytica]
MPSTIPYDPSLTLGNIVPKERLDKLIDIQKAQSPIDEAENQLNQAILLRQSFDMTRKELLTLNVPTADLDAEIRNINKGITDAATKYSKAAVAGLPAVAELREGLAKITGDYESPIDYNKSLIKEVPLASDSIRLNAQYFSFEENSQKSASQMAALKSFVAAETSYLGNEVSTQASASAQSQTNSQLENHSISGTLVITATCTHKNANLWAPFVIDVDKAIRVWNAMAKSGQEGLTPFRIDDAPEIAKAEGTDAEESYNILSGVTYGSSFVGMVHVLKESSTSSSQAMYSAASSMQAQMSVGGWFAKASGGFGVASSFANSVKNLLSQQTISSHVSMTCMGVIPTIEARDVQHAVKEFTKFSPDDMMGQLSTLQSNSVDDHSSVESAASAARTGETMVQLQNAKIESAVSAVGKMQGESNKMLDINSLMTAFTDFVTKAAESNSGVPVNYYLKPITKAQLAQMWIAKYLPAKYVTSAGDDSEAG